MAPQFVARSGQVGLIDLDSFDSADLADFDLVERAVFVQSHSDLAALSGPPNLSRACSRRLCPLASSAPLLLQDRPVATVFFDLLVSENA